MGRTRPSKATKLTPLHYELSAKAAMWNESRARDVVPVAHATQRKFTLASLELVRAYRPDFQVFDDLLVLYQNPVTQAIEGAEPDDMVILHAGELGPLESYNVPHMLARPFWVMHYVARSGNKKVPDESFGKYERDLKVPYYLTFSLDKRDLTLYRLNEKSQRYDTVLPNEHGRRAVAEVGIEVGVVDGWARFWFQGRLLLLPAELDRELQETRAELDRQRQRADRLAARLRAMGLDPEG